MSAPSSGALIPASSHSRRSPSPRPPPRLDQQGTGRRRDSTEEQDERETSARSGAGGKNSSSVCAQSSPSTPQRRSRFHQHFHHRAQQEGGAEHDGEEEGGDGEGAPRLDALDDVRRARAARLRRRLRFFFLDPLAKWRATRQFPWKLFFQLVKAFIVPLQASLEYYSLCFWCCVAVSLSCDLYRRESAPISADNFRHSPAEPHRIHEQHCHRTASPFPERVGAFQTKFFLASVQCTTHLSICSWSDTRDVLVYPPAAGPYAVYKTDELLEHIAHAVRTVTSCSFHVLPCWLPVTCCLFCSSTTR